MAFEEAREEFDAQQANSSFKESLLPMVVGNYMEDGDHERILECFDISSESLNPEKAIKYDAAAGAIIRKALEKYLLEHHHDKYHDFEPVKGCDECEAEPAEEMFNNDAYDAIGKDRKRGQ